MSWRDDDLERFVVCATTHRDRAGPSTALLILFHGLAYEDESVRHNVRYGLFILSVIKANVDVVLSVAMEDEVTLEEGQVYEGSRECGSRSFHLSAPRH